MSDLREKILWWAVKRRIELEKPFIVAITGSIAKTSTKSAIGTVLKHFYGQDVKVGYGNLNSSLGVPLSILGFEIDFYKQRITWQWLPILIGAVRRSIFNRLPKYLVLEYGADRPGDIEFLASQLSLDAAVITIVGEAHAENYSSEKEIALEKAKIIGAVKKNGFVIVNQQDKYLGEYKKSGARMVEVSTELEDMAINFARAFARELKLESLETEEALSTLVRPEGRLQLKDLGKIKLLDDSYNANPLSMQAAFNVLGKMPAPRIAILGDMLELGPDSARLHEATGKLAREVADTVIGVGELAENYKPDQHFPDSMSAAEAVLTLIGEGGSILVKGSHGVHMEKIVTVIKHHFSRLKR